MPGEYAVLRTLLSDRPIAFHPMLARVFGGINEALLFQQLAYWSDKGADPEWIYKTQKELEDEITLTRTQQENARRKLRGLGVIEEDRRGVPAKLYYRVVWEAVFPLLEAAAQNAGNLQSRLKAASKDAGNLQSGLDDTGDQDDVNQTDKIAVRTRSITENTQREQQIERPIEISRGRPTQFDPDRQTISDIMADFARELGDAAPLPSTSSRAYNIYKDSGQSIDEFIDALYEARRITKERTGSIRGATTELGKPKPKISYFFSVLSSLLAA